MQEKKGFKIFRTKELKITIFRDKNFIDFFSFS